MPFLSKYMVRFTTAMSASFPFDLSGTLYRTKYCTPAATLSEAGLRGERLPAGGLIHLTNGAPRLLASAPARVRVCRRHIPLKRRPVPSRKRSTHWDQMFPDLKGSKVANVHVKLRGRGPLFPPPFPWGSGRAGSFELRRLQRGG